MVLPIIFTVLMNLAPIQGRTELGQIPIFQPDNYTHFDVYASALNKAHYNPWTCDYRSEPGYRCLSCKSALHCYPGNFALLVQCAGIFAYCRHGYCSRFKSNECENESDHHSITSHSSTMPPYVQQEFNKINMTTVPSAAASDMDSKPQESTSNVISTQLNDPNKTDGGAVTSEAHTNDPTNSNVTETSKNK
ncbi:unnamed protein product [Spodoptera littoralis]|uniref:Uncharacterized protein n=1 Tax=Spodoptera littoralis TaxID=7109 RepID=A0A9P0I467_SPOLI|nr:unnamed protein product [Spodoptera littoralis]CAH1639119.1 unnamed protein product [Spodoptera littoralis]